MFDLRYHVASLAAVFIALVVGILVGVGISGRGFVDDVERDRRAMREVHRLQQEYTELVASLPPARRTAADVVEVRWMLEELRVSLFAQPMKTAYPVSEKRVLRAMDALAG